MKKRFLADTALILLTALTVSCTSLSFTEKAVNEAESMTETGEKIESYKASLEKEESLPLLYNLSYALLENGSYEEALSYLKRAIELCPDELRLYSASLYCAKKMRSAEIALPLLEEAVTKWPGDEKFTTAWLTALRETESESALSEAEKAIRRFPKNQAAINILADNDEYWSEKKKATLFDLKKLDLPLNYIVKRDILTRTSRSPLE